MNEMQKELNDYGIQVHQHPQEIAAAAWDQLLAQQDCPSPFMQHAYLQAMHESGSATPDSGWTPPSAAPTPSSSDSSSSK